jgi:hypothetical protein
MASQRVFKTLAEPCDLAGENWTGFLGMITDGGHAIERLSNDPLDLWSAFGFRFSQFGWFSWD